MEIELNSLIDTIKKDGVDTAKKEKELIIEEANNQASKIIADAKNEANKIVADAEIAANKFVVSGNSSLQQAGRDLTITVKKSIEDIFKNILENKVKENIGTETLKSVIPTVLTGLLDNNSDVEVLVDSKVLASVEAELKSALSAEVAKGVEIKPFDNVNAGFRVSMKDGSAFYDFTEKEVAKILSVYLNPKISELLN